MTPAQYTVAFNGSRWVALDPNGVTVAECGSGEHSHRWVSNYVKIRNGDLARSGEGMHVCPPNVPVCYHQTRRAAKHQP